jgi:lysine 2,3-aminomutase
MTTASAVHHLKPPASPDQLEYKNLKQGEFWRHIPAYADVDEATFLDHLWQSRKSVKTAEELLETIREVCSPEFYRDAEAGFHQAPMAVRVSPYAIALIDWDDPIGDPIRRQFIPLASTRCTSKKTRQCRASCIATSTRRSSYR